MSIRTLRVETVPEEMFIVEVIEVRHGAERRLDYAASCVLCDEEIANLDSMDAALAAGSAHECSEAG